jgi:probable F420-dependent oxidoreductase
MLELAGRRVTFGVHYNFRNPPQWGRPWQDVYAETLEHIQYAEELGFDDVWTTEHHFIDDGYSPSILTICAAIAARTTRVRIGTRVLLAPFYHPLRLAEDAATVDVLSGGRLILGLGLGYRNEEYAALGIPTRSRGLMLEETVAVLRQAWSPADVDFSGRVLRYSGVNVTPKPVQQPIPVWIGGSSPATALRAARIGDGLLAGGELARAYRDELQRGRPGAVSRSSVAVPWALIAEDPDAAWATIGKHVLYQRHAANRWLTDNGHPALYPDLPAAAAADRSWNPDIVVTPARARELVTQAVGQAPTAEVSVAWYGIPTGVPPGTTHRSLELFAAEMLSAASQPPPG